MKTQTTRKLKSIAGWFALTALTTAFGATSACDTGGEDDVIGGNGDADTDTDTDMDTDSETAEGQETAPYTTALVVTTDRETGAYSTIALDSHKVKKDIEFIHSDASCRFDPVTDTPFIINRMGSDAVDVLDPVTFAIETEYSAEAATNPQDIAVVSADRAYISRYGHAKMLIVEPFTGDEIGTVELSDYADDDGVPEVSGIALYNGMLLAPAERLDRDNGWAEVGGGTIVLIDAKTGEIEGDVPITGGHTYGAPEYSEALGQFVLAEPGSWSDLENAGLELYDPQAKAVSGFVITEEELGGNVTKGFIVSETKGYALIGVEGENGSNTQVVSFNPKTGKKTATVLEGAGWVYDDMALTPDQSELWVSDRTSETPGIRIVDTETDKEKTDEPIDVGLPPSAICFAR